MKDDYEGERWRPLPGYVGIYECSNLGRIRVDINASGKGHTPGLIKKTRYRNRGKYNADGVRQGNMYEACGLVNADGNKKEISVAKYIYAAWKNGGVLAPAGTCIYHINGDTLDNSAWNLVVKTRKEVAALTAHRTNRRRPVIKIMANGDEVECYRSAREAGRFNFCSYQTVLDHCHGLVKNRFAFGYSFRWDD